MDKFCCDAFRDAWCGPCLIEIDEDDIKDISLHQRAIYHLGGEYKKVKIGEIYLYEDELSQIKGEPFKFCPYCGAKLDVLL